MPPYYLKLVSWIRSFFDQLCYLDTNDLKTQGLDNAFETSYKIGMHGLIDPSLPPYPTLENASMGIDG